MSHGFFFGTIVLNLIFLEFKLMTNKIIPKKDLSFDNRKDLKKSSLEILTEENDRLLKSLKRPGGSYRAA